MNYNKNDKYEFTFTFNNDDPFYMTYHTDTIDNELLMFLIDIDIPFDNLTGFTTELLSD